MYQRRSACHSSRRPAKVMVLVAVCLIPLIGVVAIALEGGLLLDHRRQVQAAADAAALAAAEKLFAEYDMYAGADTAGHAAEAARASAFVNGYTNNETNSVVTVHIPPQTGDHVGKLGYAEVVIQFNQPRYFSRVFGMSDLPVRARAVARGAWSVTQTGILVLDLTVSESLKANGGGTVQVTNADLIVNSNNPDAVGSDGTGTLIKVVNATAQLTGGIKSNTTIVGQVQFNQPPTPDPLAYLPPPPKPATELDAKKISPNSTLARPYLDALNIAPKDVTQVYILDPGRYTRMPNFTNGDLVILRQATYNNQKGVYYLDGCGFTSTGATIVMDPTGDSSGGVMFYNDPKQVSDGINITGGKVILKPPTKPPYKGILFWQRRDAEIALQITGQGSTQIHGTFYAAGAPIKITGSSATHMDVIGSQYISRTLQSGGNGSYQVDWQPDMVAPLRRLTLVE